MRASEPAPHPRQILLERGLSANRRLGQNFLASPLAFERILEAAALTPSHAVLEIGTGLGRLTGMLAERAGHVVSVEIDRALHDIAFDRLAGRGNVTLLCADFLAGKHRINPEVADAFRAALPGRTGKVVSNLPYSISSPAVINLAWWEVPLAEIDVMVQTEVAERLCAQPGGAAYGPLTVFAAYRARVEELLRVPATAFWPRPEVSSRFVRLTPQPPSPRARDEAVFAEVVRKLFQNRRKTLGRGLRMGWGDGAAREVVERLGLDPTGRAERMGVADFVRVADVLAETGSRA